MPLVEKALLTIYFTNLLSFMIWKEQPTIYDIYLGAYVIHTVSYRGTRGTGGKSGDQQKAYLNGISDA